MDLVAPRSSDLCVHMGMNMEHTGLWSDVCFVLGNHVQIMSAETNLSYFTRVTDWGGGWIPNLRRDAVTSLGFGKSVLSFCAEERAVLLYKSVV
jgi:hypothetical protein